MKQAEEQSDETDDRRDEGVVELLDRARELLRSRAAAEKVSIHDTKRLVEALRDLRASPETDAAAAREQER